MISISSNMGLYTQYNDRAVSLKNFKGTNGSDLLTRGNKALNENKFKDAIKFYQQAKNQNPKDLKVYRQMAKAQFGLKDYASAEENFKIWLEAIH